ncbi:hypothetical protein PZE06_26805, partial [Robertmurraya sp. DFI.2.37]|nr:hypothetical protein [Robertmurraya sp. DFI.2.37]
FYYHPTMPWRSFKAINVQWRRQGTTSAKRPIKNDRFYLQKNDGWEVTPIYPDYDSEDAQISYKLMRIGYVRVGEDSIPVKNNNGESGLFRQLQCQRLRCVRFDERHISCTRK